LHKRIAITLLLIVLLPVALLGWLGMRMAHNEQQVVAAQLEALVHAQLVGVDESIRSYFQEVQDGLLAQLVRLDLGNASLRQFSQGSIQVKHILVIGGDGKRIFPGLTEALSESEKRFMQRTSALWENPKLLTQGASLAPPASKPGGFASYRLPGSASADPDKAQRSLASVASVSSGDTADASPPTMGWFAWHWNAQLHHIFWFRDAQSRMIGLELEPIALLAEVSARLPATSNTERPANASTRLVNASGQTVYEWGPYRPGVGERSLAVLPLSHPLASWKLEYFAPALAGSALVNAFGVLTAVLLFGLALAGLASYLYREHQREMRLAQQRVNFVNQVSHELKTPLTNIRLYAELLETEIVDAFADAPAQDGAKAHQYIGVITAESQRLSRLIANVLSFGQSQKSQPRLSLQPCRVDDTIMRCVGAFQPALDARAIAVHVNAHAGALVLLDPQALEQILNNLISNVEKYAASGGALYIDSRQSQDISTIAVRDGGPGIAPRERSKIFEPFYRVRSHLSEGVSGTGIGLGIARQLARLHGGDLSLQDVPDGACFQVTLHTPSTKEAT
jgi:signal transduction histidine kinase